MIEKTLDAILHHYEQLPPQELLNILASVAKEKLRNRFLSPDMMEATKSKIHNVFYIEDRICTKSIEIPEELKDQPLFAVCTRAKDYTLTQEEIIALITEDASENTFMTRTFYMVK